MSKEEKLKLVEKLVNEKVITFSEGLGLIEIEKEYIFQPYNYPIYPVINPFPNTWYSTTELKLLPDSFGTPLPDDVKLTSNIGLTIN